MDCKTCGKEIWEGSEPAKRFSPEGHHHMFDHKESCYWVRESQAGMWADRHPPKREGKTLADFAGTDKVFKRPMHGFPYFFEARGDRHLKELINGKTFWPRLTAEDLTADDWQEVTE
jgi:hypothetical protein